MARRAARGRFVRPAPRTKMWIGGGVGSVTLPSASDILVSSLSAGALALRPFTILRTHQLVHYFSDQFAASETVFGTFGHLVVTEQAAAIGITAIPDPSGISGDPEADWFVWQAMSDRVIRQTDVGFQSIVGVQYSIDSKAMRKVGPDDQVVTVFSQEASFGATMITNGRTLIQLH